MAQFTLKQLPFETDTLEPYISKRTFEFHYGKHHQGYCDKLNQAITSENVEEETIKDILANVSKYSSAVQNNAGGFWNHTFFWESLSKEKPITNHSIIEEKIKNQFESFENFKEEFLKSATSLFGSGWTWLGVKANGDLIIHNTKNQDNVLMGITGETYTPLLGLDVWEHAYYLDYQNRRPDYIENFFRIINWEKVQERLEKATN